jgi:A/G-specific adenine glycosylase
MTTRYEQSMQQFPERLLHWYDQNKRDLPWRKEKNPYYTWVSEIMLQQTRVDTVIPYFYAFIDKFPTIEALADAPQDEVLKSWEGLGYYSRARNLHHAVKEVKDYYGGVVPDTKEEISRLKGVGPYTAGAILSIAYGIPAAAVDGNVMRVFSRLFAIEDDIMKGSTRARMEGMAEQMIPPDRAGDFTQALMELGALVCTPKSPQCLLCPAMELCEGRLQGIHTTLPVKKKAKPPRPVRRVALFIKRGDGRFLIQKRPEDGLLAGLWEVPHWEEPELVQDAELVAGLLYQDYGWQPHVQPLPLGEVEHTFSHLHWTITVYAGEKPFYGGEAPMIERMLEIEHRWVTLDEARAYAFPNVMLKIIELVSANK